MIAHTIFFYIFSLIAIVAAIMVITSKNTVHSVFFLILDFISISCLFIMIGAEFLGMIMLIVYVGAVAVLFLFVVMMLNVAQQNDKFSQSPTKYSHLPIGLIVSLVIFFELVVVVGGWKFKPDLLSARLIIVVGGWKHKPELSTKIINIDSNITNTHSIGNILYTEYVHLFQLSGMILLVAMIGAIVLTFKKRTGIKRQSYIEQISREKTSGVSLVDQEINTGVKIDD